MAHYFCWSCNSMVNISADRNCVSCGSEFLEECPSDQPPIEVPEPAPDLQQFGGARARGSVPDRGQVRNTRNRLRPFPRVSGADFHNEGASSGYRPAAAANSSRSSHTRHNAHVTISSSDGTGATQVMQFDQNHPYMMMHALMDNMFNGGGLRVMVGDQMYGEPGDYVGSDRTFDRLISSLMNEMERSSGPPAAPQDAINNLPDAVVTEGQVQQSLQCSICFENFNLRERVKLLPCAHMYHKECIEKWLNMHGTCPVCRKTLSGNDTSFSEHPNEASGGGGGSGGGAAAASSSRTGRTSGGHASSSRSHNAGASSSSSSRHGASGGGGSQAGGRRHHRSHSDSESMPEYPEEESDPELLFMEHQEHGAAARAPEGHTFVDLSSPSLPHFEDHFEDASDHVYLQSPSAAENEDSNASFSSSTVAERASPARLHSSEDSSPVRRSANDLFSSSYSNSSSPSAVAATTTSAAAPAARTQSVESNSNDTSVIIVGESPGRPHVIIAPRSTSSSSTAASARALDSSRLVQSNLNAYRSSNSTNTTTSSSGVIPNDSGRRFAGSNFNSKLNSNSNSNSSSHAPSNSRVDAIDGNHDMDWIDSVLSSSISRPVSNMPRYVSAHGNSSKSVGNNKTGREREESKDEELGFRGHVHRHRHAPNDDEEVQMTGVSGPANSNSALSKRAQVSSNPKRPTSTLSGPSTALGFISSTSTSSRARNGGADLSSLSSHAPSTNAATSSRTNNAVAGNFFDLD